MERWLRLAPLMVLTGYGCRGLGVMSVLVKAVGTLPLSWTSTDPCVLVHLGPTPEYLVVGYAARVLDVFGWEVWTHPG